MSDNTYNGSPNYETWFVKNYFDRNDDLDRITKEASSRHELANLLRDYFHDFVLNDEGVDTAGTNLSATATSIMLEAVDWPNFADTLMYEQAQREATV